MKISWKNFNIECINPRWKCRKNLNQTKNFAIGIWKSELIAKGHKVNVVKDGGV